MPFTFILFILINRHIFVWASNNQKTEIKFVYFYFIQKLTNAHKSYRIQIVTSKAFYTKC